MNEQASPGAISLNPNIVRFLEGAHLVYRMLDREGKALYIGMTGRGAQRIAEHGNKYWFLLVATITLEWFATREDAARAEAHAIAEHQPPYNKIGNDGLALAQKGARPPVSRPPASLSVPDHTRAALLGLLQGNGTSARRIAVKLGRPRHHVNWWLQSLRQEGVACIEGAGAGARWRLTSALKSKDGDVA